MKMQRTKQRRAGLVLAIAVSAALAGCLVQGLWTSMGPFATNSVRDTAAEQAAPNPWAKPLDIKGAPNLHKVSDDLYRGAQPTVGGIGRLKELGIKTVVNLRAADSDRKAIAETQLAYEHIPMEASDPQDEVVIRFLQIVTDPDRTPVFVHCRHGADRTGTVCAVYRIAVEGWSKTEAIEEMTKGGFDFHGIFKSLASYVEELDMDKISPYSPNKK